MRNTFIKGLFCIATAATILTGCGSNSETKDVTASENSAKTSSEEITNESNLEDGVYYIRHSNNTYEKVYLGETTFGESSIAENPDDARIAWFKEDFNNIPTLYQGDSLVFYTEDILNEKYVFERFEDLGYSIGLCGMKETTSGRYSISTNPQDMCTYPNGDTDEILKIENESVILDKIAGTTARAVKVKEGETNPYSILSRCGTIIGLTKNQNYEADIYSGTIHKPFVFKANVRVLGSMEVTTSNAYEFNSEKLINITIPEFFNNGYYMINGQGIFRYYRGQEFIDENVSRNDMNIFNEDDSEESGSGDTHTSSIVDTTFDPYNVENAIDGDLSGVESQTDTFNVMQSGQITVSATFTTNSLYETGDGLPDITAVVTTPSGDTYKMLSYDDGLSISFNAKEIGEYKVTYYNLDIRTPNLIVTAD